MLVGLAFLIFLLTMVVAVSAALNVCFRGTLHLPHQRQRDPTAEKPLRVCVVLGSGGHTSEMFRSLRTLPDSLLAPHEIHYVVSATDTHSAQLAQRHDQERFGRAAKVHTIPRAREVGQSYTSSIRTTLVACLAALSVVRTCEPDVLLINGPGVCVPVVLAAAFWATLQPWRTRYPTTAYVESFTCVSHLSLTGKLVVPFLCDVVAYHWTSLSPVIAARQRCGRRHFIGPSQATCAGSITLAETPTYQARATPSSAPERYAVVTVGSTHFDELVAMAVMPTVCEALASQFGISKLYIQHGTTPLDLSKLVDIEQQTVTASGDGPDDTRTRTQRGRLRGIWIEAFAYRPGLSALLAGAHVVLTHAGAGTILECLESRRLTVVVPNHRLMSDHQLELAEALEKDKFLYCMDVNQITARFGNGDVQAAHLRVYPGIDTQALITVLREPLAGRTSKSA